MREEKKKLVMIVLIILIIGIIAVPVFMFPELLGFAIKREKEKVRFHFSAEDCELEGYVFSGRNLLGKSVEGYFNLSYSNYLNNFDSEGNISLFGRLGSCFGSAEGFYFDRYWAGFGIEDYYFEGESVFEFEGEVDSHNPRKRELLGFIQPDKVRGELENINLNQIILEDLSLINSHLNEKVNYFKDWEFEGENYWQTPPETLELEQGDCEDYSTALLSLFLSYNSSLNCYNIIFSSHVTTFCKIGKEYVYYDQGKTELRKEIQNADGLQQGLEELKEEYFEHYGINESERAYYAFSNNNYIEFVNKEGLIDWQASLSEKQEFKLFEELDKRAMEVETMYPTELSSEKQVLAAEKPTLRGFFEENKLMVILLGIIFIFLIVALIVISRVKEF